METLITCLDELVGDVSQRDGHFMKRRYVDEAFYGMERRRKESPTIYADKLRLNFQRMTSAGIEVDEELQGHILMRMLGLSEAMHQSVLSISQGEINIAKFERRAPEARPRSADQGLGMHQWLIRCREFVW